MKKQLLLTRMLLLVALLVGSVSAWGAQTTFTLTSASAPSDDNFTLTYGGAGNNPVWQSGSGVLRFYAKNAITFASNNGEKITSITFTGKVNANNKGSYPTGMTATNGSITPSSISSTGSQNFSWTNATGTESVTITIGGSAGNIEIGSFTITYTPAYTITAQSNNTDYGTVSLNGSVITASPKPGYRYASPAYSVSPANSATVSQNGNEFTVTPSANTTVTINFEEDNTDYDITLNQTSGGTIEASATTAKYGTQITLTPTPDSGYRLVSWTVLDGDANEVTVTNNKFTMPASDVIVTATFKKVHTITYYIDRVENSITRVDGEELNIPVSASGFAGWTEDDTNVTPSISNDDVVTDDMELYAVFVKEKVTNYQLVEADQADWRGDYLIAYSSTIFADGRVGGTGTGGIGAANVQVNPESNLSGNVVDVDWGDTYKVTFEAKNDADLSEGYVLKTQDGNYNYQSSNSSGLATSENKETAATYAFSVIFTSSSDIKLKLSGNAKGAVFRYNTNGYFRFYKDGGQDPVYLYKRTENATYSLSEYEAVTITSAGRATFSSTNALDFTGADVEAYIAKSTDGSNVTFTSVNVVPANTGLLVKGDKGTYYIPVTTASTDDVSANKMESTASAAHNVTSEEYGKAFVFGKKSDEIGFFKAAVGKTVAQGKSYLLLDAAPAKDVEFIDIIYNNETEEQSETTSISDELRAKSEDSAAYNLAGQKVGADYKGIVIVNGKKVIIK